MKIFFDTEFTGLYKDTTLISIGLVDENGRIFYAELTDYDWLQVNEWIEENVIANLLMKDRPSELMVDRSKNTYRCKGNRYFVRKHLVEWLGRYSNVEWVSDVCHYDFVLLIDLLCDHALNIPYGVWNAACHDINQDIANRYNVSEIKAFDMSRESIIEDIGMEIEGEKHNALYDAYVIKAIYDRCFSK